MSNQTVLLIVATDLMDRDYDGLYDADGDCACELADLMPCARSGGGPNPTCTAGYKAPCDCGEHDWHIQEVKP